MKSFIQLFSSVKLAVFLLIIITLASILGTLIPQNRSQEAYQEKYGNFSELLTEMEITRLYQSWWYISILFLFGLNTTVCTLKRLTSKFRQTFKPRISVPEKRILKYTEHKKIRNFGGRDTEASQLKQLLKTRHFRVKEAVDKDTHNILARKKTAGIFGADIVHVGILIILIGGILTGAGGFRRNLNIIEGQTVDVPQADFQIRLDKFETEYYPKGAVKDWKSTLTVIESGKEIVTKTIEVNHPLSYKGYVFYQSSYGWDWNNLQLDILVMNSESDQSETEIQMTMEETYTLTDGVTQVTALSFVPDFVITEGNRVATRSMQPNNPAVYLKSTRNNAEIFSGWIFAKFPDFSQSHQGSEQPISFILEEVHAPQYSGIQAARDPGTNVIWGGCLVLMLGLFAAFYWPSRTLRFKLSSSGSHTEILAGGESKKNQEEFQREFHTIISELRRSK